ncbi:MAG: aldo/keto reductase, partial [Bacteroidales bacterium]|nr:aldo/keto reductase [Bacteroidales bacterium]
DGRVRAIGVSNFLEHHMQPLLDSCRIKPMVDQIEIHPGYSQQTTVDFCQRNGIAVEAWSPFGRGIVFKNETLIQISEKYGKSVAQICIRWCLQKGIVPLPKSVTPDRIKNNLEVFDFELSPADMQTIDQMQCFGWSGQHPDEVEL